MGSWTGHIASGVGFIVIGLWHLFNHIRIYSVRPGSYRTQPWFPVKFARYLEHALIIAGSLTMITMELFVSPAAHQPLDSDGSIPSYHLHNFEHATIALSLIVYSTCAIHLDRSGAPRGERHAVDRPIARDELTLLVVAVALAQELLLFHVHSTDHVGVEGQYHWLLQCVIIVTLATALLSIAHPASFVISFVRSVSLVFQGVWLIVMGVMLYAPGLMPKGCYLHDEDGRVVVGCSNAEAVYRGKSLVNLEFSWYMSATVVFAVAAFLYLTKLYPEEPEYIPLIKGADENGDDLEAQDLAESQSFLRIHAGMKPIELERKR